jgi:hypothetical protein
MMTPEELCSSLRDLLVEERVAIRALDSAEVERASHAKEALLAELVAKEPSERAAYLEKIEPLRDELKRNLILLAHARDCMREVVTNVQTKGGRVSIEL